MLGGTAVFIISLVDITLAKTVVPTTLAGIVVPATFVVTVVSTIIFGKYFQQSFLESWPF